MMIPTPFLKSNLVGFNQDSSFSTCHRLAMERDNAERDSRQKETTIINLTLELDELRDRLEEVERLRITQARELDELTLDVCKSVSVN